MSFNHTFLFFLRFLQNDLNLIQFSLLQEYETSSKTVKQFQNQPCILAKLTKVFVRVLNLNGLILTFADDTTLLYSFEKTQIYNQLIHIPPP